MSLALTEEPKKGYRRCWKCTGTGETWLYAPFGSILQTCVVCEGEGQIE